MSNTAAHVTVNASTIVHLGDKDYGPGCGARRYRGASRPTIRVTTADVTCTRCLKAAPAPVAAPVATPAPAPIVAPAPACTHRRLASGECLICD